MSYFIKKSLVGLVLSLLTTSVLAEKNIQLDLNGLVEVELGSSEEYNGSKNSGVSLGRLRWGIDAQVSSWASVQIQLIHEDGETEPLEVDEGIITLANADESAFSFTGGRMDLPFVLFKSNMISDPVTLELGETRETVVLFGFDSFVDASFFLFNGDTLEVGSEDNIEHFGFNVGMSSELESLEYTVGFSYISSFGDTDSIFELVSANREAATAGVGVSSDVLAYVPGISVNAEVKMGQFSAIGEFVGATDTFDVTEFSVAGVGAQPSAYNFELAFTMGDTVYAVALQGTKEAAELELPESRILVGLSTEIVDGAILKVEYAVDDDYDTAAATSATGGSRSHFLIQLATKF